MHNDGVIKLRSFTRRALLLGAGKLSLLSMLVGRLYYLQILKSAEYRTLSENNSIRLFVIPPLRGEVFDRNQVLLASNRNYYRIILNKDKDSDIEQTINHLAHILKLDDEAKEEMIKKAQQQKYNSQIFLENLSSWEDVVKIEVNSIELPGIYVDVAQVRYYPYSHLCAHLIGYIGAPTEKEINKNAILNHQDIRVGKTGIEKTLNNELAGEAGFKKMEVNAHGVVVRQLTKEESKAGENINLTIDINLQKIVTEKLNQKGGSAVVIDVTNGEILALNSTPSFDTNQFAKNLPAKYWEELIHDPYFPMLNKSVTVQYPPGSVFKLMVATAALEEGISPETTYHCPGYVAIGEKRFYCWRKEGHGTLNLNQALSYSCNCYFWNLAARIGVEKITKASYKFGLGQKTNIELPNEALGLIPDKKWKKKRFGKEWQLGDTFNTAVGQGFVLSTPLQLAVMAARIASGKKVVPHLIKKIGNQIVDNHAFSPLDVKETNLKIIRKGMYDVVNLPGATAYGSKIFNQSMEMAGKTGTSQVISKKSSHEDLSKGNVAWFNKNHGLFVAFAPFHQPKYACAVVIEHGGSGSGAAAPVARDIMLELQRMDAEK